MTASRAQTSSAKPPFLNTRFAPRAVDVEKRADGSLLLRSPQTLGPYRRSLIDYLAHFAETTPEALFLAERAPDGLWRKLGYAEVLAHVGDIAAALLDRGLTPDRPIMILSDNSIDHALLALAGQMIGVPAAPISPAYSLMSRDHAKLKAIAELLDPGLVYAGAGRPFEAALAAIGALDDRLVVSADPPETKPDATRFSELLTHRRNAAVDRAFAAVTPDSVAKILFTSGSTGLPKGVINTQRMLTSNQQMLRQAWTFLNERPPVIVDWLPWNHTFGANNNFGMILTNGGSLYIDAGKPVPGLIEKTVANLREVPSTVYYNVPRGFDVLLDYLDKDAELRRTFFQDLDLIVYAGAGLPQNLWERIEALSIAERGVRVPLISSWGSTETAPLATTVHFTIEKAGNIGLPVPGVEMKMVPNAGKLEMRLRGPNITPGYWNRPDLTRDAFDAEGFYMIGDAGRFVDPDDPSQGIVFDGRTAENFKLTTGTWVHVGQLRMDLIAACSPVVQDAVITGENQPEIGLLLFPNLPGCRQVAGDLPEDASAEAVIADRRVREHVRQALSSHNLSATGSSMKVARALLMAAPPSIDAGEITDKGYINQRAVRDNRADLVGRLHAGEGEDVITV